ncbi:MAG TPA: hypothetical protein VMV33_10005 [Rhodocyclaceae bacterium]|nr:hypothetical protein [Rhodocyclaceae bacterium]
MNALTDLPRVKAVKASKKPWTLAVTWADGSRSNVDLTGLIHTSRHFRVFLAEPAAFKKVGPVGHGSGIAWDNGLDYAAATLRTLAREQSPMTGADLVDFERAHGLNTAETAALLDMAERTVRSCRHEKVLPQTVAIALRALADDPTILAAHYKPVAIRPRGRPKKQDAA